MTSCPFSARVTSSSPSMRDGPASNDSLRALARLGVYRFGQIIPVVPRPLFTTTMHHDYVRIV